MNLKTNLFDPTALTYSTKTGLLYTTDFAWMDAKEGGLFRIDDDPNNSGKAVIVTKITSLDKPTAAAFAPDGALYVTVFGKEDNRKGRASCSRLRARRDPL